MKKFPLILLIAALPFIIGALALTYVRTGYYSMHLTAAERWQGESEKAFVQMGAYFPETGGLSLEDVYIFRNELETEYAERSVVAEENERLYKDGWSGTGKLKIFSETDSVEASVTACGGDFFFFHPIKLVSGSYFSDDDESRDLIVLDKELAWRLFGGTDIAGQVLFIQDRPFFISGVIERETDKASTLNYSDGMGFYMSFEAFRAINENARATSYEIVLQEVVEDFAENFMKEKLTGSTVISNTGRLTIGSGLKIIKNFGGRSAQNMGLKLPYWENAARYLEDYNALLSGIIVFLFAVPALLVLIDIIILIVFLSRKIKTAVRSRIIDIDYR